MPSIDQNLDEWNAPARWKQQGDEWSASWGGAEAQWYGAVYPRIHAYIPAANILEIAPGHGRWTQYLKDYCERLMVVDLAQSCIDQCRERFASIQHIEYHVNDGRSLAMIRDESTDFAFSFDSLVHCEIDVIRAYVGELATKLRPNGIAFIHHSNAGEYRRKFLFLQKLPHRAKALFNLVGSDHWRAHSVTASEFERLCEAAGLVCISQELINWGSPYLIDCFTTFTRKGSSWTRPNRILRNREFMVEAKLISALSPLYSRR